MRISARADYAVRAAAELAAADHDGPVRAEALARAQDIPHRFLEGILSDLRRDGLVTSHRGAGGGYRLARSADSITIADVVRAVDGPLVFVRGTRPSDLADQIEAGAPADVVATADEPTMARLSDAGLVAAPTLFATNVLTIVVPTGNPGDIRSLADLGRRDVDVVLCAPEVPCGRAAAAVADGAGVTPHTVSEEPSVTDVLAKIALDEADAGLVYVTDAATQPDDVETIPTPEAADVVNRYPVAALSDPPSPDLADEWIALVTGDEGRSVLSEAGFGAP